MRTSMFDAQLATLYCHSVIWLAGLNVDIPFNTREYFSLSEFGPLCIQIIATFYDIITVLHLFYLPVVYRYNDL
jgi:hypothetical protein